MFNSITVQIYYDIHYLIIVSCSKILRKELWIKKSIGIRGRTQICINTFYQIVQNAFNSILNCIFIYTFT